ncbi:MAG TPA: ATP-binding cassette domain-containing protein [Erysipelotrichaceae bacterium]|nr:ATP-binding cassette domain-containing protein [Erysipelotrichaceae bacterium]
MENNKPFLKVERLKQYFKLGKKELPAVDDISFDIYKGEVFGLVGESGCGKTTTGRTIIRLYDATGGSVYFDGTRIVAGIRNYKDAIKQAKAECKATLASLKAEFKNNRKSEEYAKAVKVAYQKRNEIIAFNVEEIKKARHDHRNCNREYGRKEAKKVDEKYLPLLEAETDNTKRAKLKKQYKKERKLALKDRIMNRIQMIFQDPIASLDPRMTVKDIIAEGLIIRGIKDKKVINKQVYKVLDMVGLVEEHATRYPHEFSGGQRQRIGIARAIILEPDLIIADEPISALDVSIQAQIINLLNDLRDKMGLTILFIAHDLSVVKYFSDRIAVMYYGKIVEFTTSDELFKHPLHPYTKSLLSAIPLPDPRYEKKRKRITYNPLRDHDYTQEGPVMREVISGHFVYCNSEEFNRYQEEIKAIDAKEK